MPIYHLQFKGKLHILSFVEVLSGPLTYWNNDSLSMLKMCVIEMRNGAHKAPSRGAGVHKVHNKWRSSLLVNEPVVAAGRLASWDDHVSLSL